VSRADEHLVRTEGGRRGLLQRRCADGDAVIAEADQNAGWRWLGPGRSPSDAPRANERMLVVGASDGAVASGDCQTSECGGAPRGQAQK
jgi:hypothetical protein